MKELIKSLKQPMFASRDTIEDAYDYALMVAKATDNPAAVMAAVQVVVNTIANELEKIAVMIEEDIDSINSNPYRELEQIVDGWVRE